MNMGILVKAFGKLGDLVEILQAQMNADVNHDGVISGSEQLDAAVEMIPAVEDLAGLNVKDNDMLNTPEKLKEFAIEQIALLRKYKILKG